MQSKKNLISNDIGNGDQEMFDNVFKIPLSVSLKHRLPWLIIGLIGGILVAQIVSGFEEVLSENIVLAAFIPLIVYIADAVGTQIEAFIIRDLALNPKLNFVMYLLKQASIVGIIGVIMSSILYLITLVIYHDPKISLVVSLSMFVSVMASLVTGLVIPYVFGKVRLDPANASGPIATIIQDLLSILVYFSIAKLILT